ncbi:hypothetical protein GW17_00051374 [Ensete ventricosum]|nr:hypothetical protein GW17_00051374 [Ensete ventricosum]
MASVDLIIAKLEAFEMCIEDKLCTLFAEFRLGRSPSLTRSQQDVDLESEEEDTEEKSQPTVSTAHALSGYMNPQTIKIDGSLKQQPVTGQALPEVPPLAELATASDVAPPNLGLFPKPLPGGYMLLKVFSVDDLRSTTDDHKKIELLQRQY